GAGFIGSHVCARLLADGHEVICADNLITGSAANIQPLLANPRFHFERVDITQPCPFEADAIFNLASPASPVGYMEHPFETIRANSVGTTELLTAARRSGARFLMASTSEAYGDPLVHPQTEDYFGNVNPVGPRACYDESKRLGETITAEFHRQFGLDARIVRIFNTYGPQSQLHDGRMVPNFIVQAVNGAPLAIHGSGAQTRSICYVDDLVAGLLAAMFTPGTAGAIFNLGNPEEHTVLEWARMIIRICGSRSTIVFEDQRQDDPVRRRPDITKARQRLNWSPRISPEEGLRRTVEWFRGEIEREQAPAPVGAE
ncbi:MAG TPA: UDP-glucuronic acid decarboxylase family protein, partial [Ktedonobacterales bacterium]